MATLPFTSSSLGMIVPDTGVISNDRSTRFEVGGLQVVPLDPVSINREGLAIVMRDAYGRTPFGEQYICPECPWDDGQGNSGPKSNVVRSLSELRLGEGERPRPWVREMTGQERETLRCQTHGVPFEDYAVVQNLPLINEALDQPGFVGHLLVDADNVIKGFSFGYNLPGAKIMAGDFPVVRERLAGPHSNRDPDNVVYGAELGVADPGDRGHARELVTRTIGGLMDARPDGSLVITTTERSVHNGVSRLFSKGGEPFFNDPTTGNDWYVWDAANYIGPRGGGE